MARAKGFSLHRDGVGRGLQGGQACSGDTGTAIRASDGLGPGQGHLGWQFSTWLP